MRNEMKKKSSRVHDVCGCCLVCVKKVLPSSHLVNRKIIYIWFMFLWLLTVVDRCFLFLPLSLFEA